MIDKYLCIEGHGEGEFRDRGSKFLGFAHPASSEEEVKEVLQKIAEAHPKAGHLCYAYRLDLEKKIYRANDDGEPSGTAGKPILGQIDSKGVSKVLVAVIRYWGGTKLGVSGLINAYRTAAAEALSNATIIEKTVSAFYKFSFSYELMNEVMRLVKRNKWKIHEQFYEEQNILIVSIPVNSREEDEKKMDLLRKMKYEWLYER